MNKSKFLRKSLALLLSVLMVVAMIPVGASAADKTTDLAAMFIAGKSVSVENKTFAAEVDTTNVKMQVKGLQTGETAKLLDKDGDLTSVDLGSAEQTVNLTNYVSNGNVYTLTMRLTMNKATTDYTVKVTVVAKKTTVELESAVAYLDPAKTNKAIKTAINGKTINVTVPYGYASGGKVALKAKDGATISGSTTFDADLTDKKTVVVTSEAGSNTSVYTIKVTEAPALTSLSIGGVATTIDHTKKTIEATYPASVLVDSKTTGKCEAEDFAVAFTALADTKVVWDANGTSKELKNSKTYDFTDGNNAFQTSKKITVAFRGVTCDYAVTLTDEKASDCTVTAATIDGETATVAGSKITANIAKALDNTTATAKVVLTIAETASITGWTKEDDGVYSNNTYKVADLKNGVVVNVTAQDGSTKQYEIKVTVTGDVNSANLISFALRIGTVDYPATISGTSVKVTVPYMTTDKDLADAKIVWATNPYVGLYTDAAKTTPVTTGNTAGLTTFANVTKKGGTATGTVYAVGKNSSDVLTKYDITVSLEAAKPGVTLASLTATSASKTNDVKAGNTYAGSLKTDKDTMTGTVTFSTSYTDCTKANNLYVKSFSTNNGGVAYVYDGSKITAVEDLVLNTTYTYVAGTAFAKANTTSGVSIYVVDEVVARAYENKTSSTSVADLKDGYVYTVKTESQKAKDGATLSNIKVGETVIGNSISGTVAYGVTTGASTSTIDAEFIEFNISEGATLTVTDDTSSNTVTLVSGGEKDTDGTAKVASTTNGALLFVRDTTKGTVDVYGWAGASATAFKATKFVVTAEDGSTKNEYAIKTINYAAPNTEAQLTAFSVAGVAGSIKAEGNENWVITVNVPMGTDVTSLVPTFSASAGATVNSVNAGTALKSGETVVDFTSSDVLTVVSEDDSKKNTYTVKVTVSDSFSDVKPTDWFYNNVMAAYNAGYCSGNPDGSFAPNNNITRRDVAIMVYKMMGSPAVTATTSFADVTADDYAATAIAFLKESDIVSGDAETGKFRPGASITRQEAASILAKAKKLSGTTDNLFNDDAKISDWAKPAVYACRAAGVFNGDNNGNFNAQANITRAEVATAVLQAASK